MQDLEELPLVLMPVEYYLRRMVETECAEAQIKTQVVLEMNFPLGILQAVAEKGRTLRLYLTVRPIETCRPGLWGVDLYDPVPRHPVGLAYRGNRYQDMAAREFGTLCRTTMTCLFVRTKHSPRSAVTSG